MSIESAACAVAAADLGYPTFAEVIASEQLPPRVVATMMRASMAKDAGMVVAVIILAASTARWQAQHHGWDGEAERLLALDALADKAAFDRAANRAAQIVADHWQEISGAKAAPVAYGFTRRSP